MAAHPKSLMMRCGRWLEAGGWWRTARRRWPVAAVVAIAMLCCASPLAAQRQSGPAPTAAARPAERIVSLVPAVTEMLFAIGAGPQLVGVSNYDDFPPDVRKLPQVGALLDPDVERVLTLHPDLVVSYATQTDLHAQLGRARIPVFSYRHAGLDGIFSTIEQLGPAVGRAPQATQLVRDLRAQLERVRAAVRGRTRPRTLLVFGREPGTLRGLYVSGGRGFLHDMLETAGGANVFADVDRESVQPSQETLLARAPDVIIEIKTGGMAPGGEADARKAWTSLGSIPAVRTGRIQFLVGDELVVPGPRVAQGTEALAKALHPEAFR